MSFFELFMLALALSMDAFTVALLKGLTMKRVRYQQIFLIALFFGGFQAVMPLLGWLMGQKWNQYVVAFDHWIALILLGFIGGKMIVESLRGDPDGNSAADTLSLRELLLLSIATSIDALAVGITFAFLQVQIIPSIAFIGTTTFILSAMGVILGKKCSTKFMKSTEIFGGSVLILIGIKILLEHLGIL